MHAVDVNNTDTYRLPLDYWFFEVIRHVYTVQCEVLCNSKIPLGGCVNNINVEGDLVSIELDFTPVQPTCM